MENGNVSPDFIKQLSGFGLTTAHIIYRIPDHLSILQSYIYQLYDVEPEFPKLHTFLKFWEEKLDGPLFRVTITHSHLIKPVEINLLRWFH